MKVMGFWKITQIASCEIICYGGGPITPMPVILSMHGEAEMQNKTTIFADARFMTRLFIER